MPSNSHFTLNSMSDQYWNRIDLMILMKNGDPSEAMAFITWKVTSTLLQGFSRTNNASIIN